MTHETHETAEHNQSLWLLVWSPVIWAGHFLLSYLTAAIWCAKFAGADDGLWKVRLAISAYTVVALIGISIVGWIGCRRHGYGSEKGTLDFDTPADRHRFLGFATLLLSGLSAVAVLFAAMVIIFFHSCH